MNNNCPPNQSVTHELLVRRHHLSEKSRPGGPHSTPGRKGSSSHPCALDADKESFISPNRLTFTGVDVEATPAQVKASFIGRATADISAFMQDTFRGNDEALDKLPKLASVADDGSIRQQLSAFVDEFDITTKMPASLPTPDGAPAAAACSGT